MHFLVCWLIFFIPFLAIIATVPRFILTYVSRLFSTYKGISGKDRLFDLFTVYILFSVGLALSFNMIISSLSNTNYNSNFPLYFIVSFSFIWGLRIMTLMDKTKLLLKIFPEKWLKFITESNKTYRWDIQREYTGNFIFSIFFLSMFNILINAAIWMVDNLNLSFLKETHRLIDLAYQGLESLVAFLMIILITGCIFFLSWVGEFLLKKVGIHPYPSILPFNKEKQIFILSTKNPSKWEKI